MGERHHCLSAFTAFLPCQPRRCHSRRCQPRHHCLSAFTAFLPRWSRAILRPGRPCHHCLSAFTAFLPGQMGCTVTSEGAPSPLPFGIHRVPAPKFSARTGQSGRASPLPFGIHRVPAVSTSFGAILDGVSLVTIAFRHSPRSCLDGVEQYYDLGDRVTIAFRHSPRSCPCRTSITQLLESACHHCLSAFTAFLPEVFREQPFLVYRSPLPFGIHRVPALQGPAESAAVRYGSPLPFGIHRVPAQDSAAQPVNYAQMSPLPFGIHRVPAKSAEGWTILPNGKVTIAFRHSPRSCRVVGEKRAWNHRHGVTIAFRHSPRSCRFTGRRIARSGNTLSPLPFGIHRVPAWASPGSHSLRMPTVTIAFRHSPRSCRVPSAPILAQMARSPLPFGIHRVPA